MGQMKKELIVVGIKVAIDIGMPSYNLTKSSGYREKSRGP